MQVANIMEEQNRLNDAYTYVQVACDTYREVYGDSSDNSIIALWLRLQIAYTQSTQKNASVVDMADNLFKALV
jgi:Zn-dependent metalloprotease